MYLHGEEIPAGWRSLDGQDFYGLTSELRHQELTETAVNMSECRCPNFTSASCPKCRVSLLQRLPMRSQATSGASLSHPVVLVWAAHRLSLALQSDQALSPHFPPRSLFCAGLTQSVVQTQTFLWSWFSTAGLELQRGHKLPCLSFQEHGTLVQPCLRRYKHSAHTV